MLKGVASSLVAEMEPGWCGMCNGRLRSLKNHLRSLNASPALPPSAARYIPRKDATLLPSTYRDIHPRTRILIVLISVVYPISDTHDRDTISRAKVNRA